MARSLQDQRIAAAGRRLRNTAELSGEVSVGDVVVVGEAALAVARAGWLPLPGPFTPVRHAEPGTRPFS
jgi:hypothetical protein